MKWIKATERKPDNWHETICRKISTKWVIPSDYVYKYHENSIEMDNYHFAQGRNGLEIEYSDVEWLDEIKDGKAGMTNEQIHEMCEAVADTAYIAGQKGWKSGDGHAADIAQIIVWGAEFYKLHEHTKWGEDLEYPDTIYSYTIDRINPS